MQLNIHNCVTLRSLQNLGSCIYGVHTPIDIEKHFYGTIGTINHCIAGNFSWLAYIDKNFAQSGYLCITENSEELSSLNWKRSPYRGSM